MIPPVQGVLPQRNLTPVVLYDTDMSTNIYEQLTQAETRRLQNLDRRYRSFARQIFAERAEYFQKLTGGVYTKITVRDQRTRWGSCSSNGTLSFNYRLVYAPPHVLDYVVVHELCHLTHMDHSKEFWQMVESIMPDYRDCRKWLKEHGQELTIADYLNKQGQQVRL